MRKFIENYPFTFMVVACVAVTTLVMNILF